VSSLQLRAWQGRFAQTLKQHRGENFLLVACPAAGKTIAAGAALAAVMDERDLDQLIVISPTVVVRDQWQRVLASLGYRMRTRFPAEGWPAHIHGVCANYHQVVQRINSYAAACQQRRTAVIFDEIHHAGAQRSWGAALNEAFEAAQLRLLLSGTPFRSDQDRIPFVRYQNDGSCIADFHYEYAQAVRDGVCRPIEFRAHDGLICWQDKHGQQTARLSEPVGNARAARLRASLDPRQPYLQSLLQAGEEDLCVLREEVPDAGGLIICDSQAHALEVERLIGELTGRNAVLAISDRPGAHQAILDFARSERRWLISVRMVSEGVDIPRLAVGVYATSTATPLYFAQAVGRFVRARSRGETASIFLPSIPHLLGFAAEMEVERDHVLGRRITDEDDLYAAEQDLLARANADVGASDELEGSFEALGSEARFDRVVYDGGEFGHEGVVHVGSDEEMDFLGIPGLLDHEQVRELLHHRQRSRRTTSSGAAPEREVSTHEQLAILRRELNGLVAAWHHRTGQAHGITHSALRKELGGPAAAIANAEQLHARINRLREWASRPTG
jgi:superfamily II DNA or RNA helicase